MIEFDNLRIRDLLAKLDARLTEEDITATIFVVGGAAMALKYNNRRTTADIDGVIDLQTRSIVLDAAHQVADEESVPKTWLSDGVREVMPAHKDDHPRRERIGDALTIEIASPEYLLAMKAMTSRQSEGDLADAALLCKELGITKESGIDAVVARYFGPGPVGAQELFFERIIDRASTL